jgi:hypothetical protein
MRPSSTPIVLVLLVGCASSSQPTTASDRPDSDSDPEAPAAPPIEAQKEVTRVANLASEQLAATKARQRDIPNQCAVADAKVCSPPASFVEQLCKIQNPDVALAMFSKQMPWTRAWVRGNLEAWYASARRSRPRQLKYAEEVIVVATRGGGGSGVQVSGAGSYDVYRWDGSCVSLMEGEITFHQPATPDVAVIDWKHLDDGIKDALEKNQSIAFRSGKRRDACRDASEKGVKNCEKAEAGLSRSIAEYVRGGGDFPTPTLLPTATR